VNRQVVAADDLAEAVDGYARRVYPAVLEQHDADSVCSPLGVWMLLAACAAGAVGVPRRALERSLGCTAKAAGDMLARLMSHPPPALKAAIAVWVREIDATPEFRAWARDLRDEVETGGMPTQQQADDWASRRTLGLIEMFPLSVDALTRIVLASALATKVSWPVPFEVVAADPYLGQASPWRGRVERLLWDPHPARLTCLLDTRAAGVVAVHVAEAVEELEVISVSADPSITRARVLEAAHEAIGYVRDRPLGAAVHTLFELPLGRGHSWQIQEREVASWTAGERRERVEGAALPAWRLRGELDLKRSERFGCSAALTTMRALIGPQPDDRTEAKQSAVAAFSRFGFEAAAVTGIAVRASAQLPPTERGVERTATLCFDHPYVAVAIAADLPLFTAWIATPQEPESEPANQR
jgi:hypothetical protein